MRKDLDIAIKYLFYSGELFGKLNSFYRFYKYLTTNHISSIGNLHTAIVKWSNDKDFQEKIWKIVIEHPDLLDCTESEIVELRKLLDVSLTKVVSKTPWSIERFENDFNSFYNNKIDIKLALDCDETLIKGLSKSDFKDLYKKIFFRLNIHCEGSVLQMKFISKFIELESKLNSSEYRITRKVYYKFWYTRTSMNSKMIVFMSDNVRLKDKIARYLFVSNSASDSVIEYLLDSKRYALFSDYGHHYSALYKRNLFKIIFGSIKNRYDRWKDGIEINVILHNLRNSTDIEYFRTHHLTEFVDILNLGESSGITHYINHYIDPRFFQQLFHDSYVKYGDEENIKFICVDGKVGLELI